MSVQLTQTIIIAFSGVFSFFAIVVSVVLIYKHLRTLTNVEEQKQIARILLMVPIYAFDSFMSLLFENHSWVIFLTIGREWSRTRS